MKTDSCIKCIIFSTAVLVFLALTNYKTVYASIQTIEADGYYIVGDGPNENITIAQNRARMEAKRAVAEKAGIYVESITKVENGQLTKDEINVISAQVMQIDSEKIIPEVIGETIRYCCHIVAKVDSSNLNDKLIQDRQRLYEAIDQNKRLQESLDAVNKELAKLKSQFKNANESQRQTINNKIAVNERNFTALEWLYKGFDYFQRGNYTKSIECNKKALEIQPNCDYAWNNLGVNYQQLGDIHKAIECTKKVTMINPKFDAAWHNLGVYYRSLGDLQKEIEYMQKAVQVNPNNYYSWADLGSAYGNLGNQQKSIECSQRALQINPKFDSAWHNLGVSYYLLGNKQKAREYAQKALRINPNSNLYRQFIAILK
ncbi:tetratricopeptide repeat protein [Selenomonas ruminantium]|uniref:Tfp pilus assembly protein PilF n=1 Tax=Selenomonas ruminantium TaxID=971 RepID=A0A1K1M2S2_SELRU|nr:tetratricopeptide repeat protein [Selenomonas ruminantium]SFW17458.1 Tfp pilus assembly protein PilF [Selenomonas ruminantium]